MIRVLQLIDGLGLGGAQSYLVQLCRSNPYPDVQLDVACLHGRGPFAAILEEHQIPCHTLSSARWNPVFLPRLRRLIRSGGYDLVHAHLVVSGFVCEALHGWLGRPRLVEHLHSPVGTHTGSEYQRLLERLMFRHATRYIACSRVVGASLEAFRPAVGGRIVTLPNGVELETLERGRRAPGEIRRELGLSAEDFVIGSAGRLSPLKNYPLLLRAAASLRQRIPRLKVVLFGAGGEEEKLRALVRELGLESLVIMPGYDPQASQKLGLFDLFILPSDYEGLPMVLLEAMAASVACITTDFPSAGEVLRHEADGLIVPRGDTAALAGAIERLAGDRELRERLGAAGRRKVAAEFSMKQHWETLRRVYLECLGQRD